MDGQTEQDGRRYLTLTEVGQRLGFGLVRRIRSPIGKKPISDSERLARPVRRAIRRGDIRCVWDSISNCYLIREDWIEDYERKRISRASERPFRQEKRR